MQRLRCDNPRTNSFYFFNFLVPYRPFTTEIYNKRDQDRAAGAKKPEVAAKKPEAAAKAGKKGSRTKKDL